MFRFVRIPLLAIALSLAGSNAAATAGERDLTTVQEVVTAVESTYANVESLRADFVQVSRTAALGDEHRQRGRVVLKRPRKMRWEFQSPDTKLFVTDGQTMWVWSPADNQVIVYRDFAAGAPGLTSLLSDLNQLNELFEVTLVDDGERSRNAYVLDLRPLNAEQASFKSARIELSRRKLLVERVVITDAFDNVTDLAFSQVRIDTKVNDGEFTFQVPSGAEVISPEGL